MTKEMIELINQINGKKNEVKELVAADKIDEAKAAKAELEKLQAKFDIMKDIEVEQAQAVQDHGKAPKEANNDPIHAFANAARRRFANDIAYPNEGTAAQGGYTVPQDIQTKINEFKQDRFALETLVDVVGVTAPTGSRVYQTRANHAGFSLVAEAGAIGQVAAPEFSVINYAVSKYAGYLPVTNELLADSDANIASVLIKWLGEEDIATRNNIILSKLATLTTKDLANLDGIKHALNVDLGAKFIGSSSIITNDDGFNYLDTLKNGQSEYLLKPSMDPTKPMERRLAVGATTIPVVVVPNAVLASGKKSGKTVMPFYVGDMKEALTIFDRKKVVIDNSTTASVSGFNAFEQDMTLFRAIERLDCQFIDNTAVIAGTITEA